MIATNRNHSMHNYHKATMDLSWIATLILWHDKSWSLRFNCILCMWLSTHIQSNSKSATKWQSIALNNHIYTLMTRKLQWSMRNLGCNYKCSSWQWTWWLSMWFRDDNENASICSTWKGVYMYIGMVKWLWDVQGLRVLSVWGVQMLVSYCCNSR